MNNKDSNYGLLGALNSMKKPTNSNRVDLNWQHQKFNKKIGTDIALSI